MQTLRDLDPASRAGTVSPLPAPSSTAESAAPGARSRSEWLHALLPVAYPFLVVAALQGLSARWVALLLALVVSLRAMGVWRRPLPGARSQLLVPAVLVGGVLLGSALFDDERFLLLVPTCMNVALLVAFARTLVGDGPTLVETFARLQVPDLPEAEVAYCRQVTGVWCAFFVLNGSVALVLALSGDRLAWALYTGVLSYVCVGLLFSAEFAVRAWRFGRHEGTVVEPLFRRLFPRGPVG